MQLTSMTTLLIIWPNLHQVYNAHMESNKIWKSTLIDAGDGSGDALLELPDEILAKVGWVEDELLEIEQVGKCIIIKKHGSKSSYLTIKRPQDENL